MISYIIMPKRAWEVVSAARIDSWISHSEMPGVWICICVFGARATVDIPLATVDISLATAGA